MVIYILKKHNLYGYKTAVYLTFLSPNIRLLVRALGISRHTYIIMYYIHQPYSGLFHIHIYELVYKSTRLILWDAAQNYKWGDLMNVTILEVRFRMQKRFVLFYARG